MKLRILTLAAVMAAAGGTAQAAPFKLNLLGQQIIATGTTFGGVPIGGLSGIDYDPNSGTFTALSDDRGDTATPRFYNLSLGYSLTGFSSVTFNTQTTMKRPDGTVFPGSPRQVDPESLRLSGNGTIYWSSEGNYNNDPALRFNPFVREMTANGSYVRDFAVPTQFNYTQNQASGGRSNLLFEAMTLTPGGRLVSANEGAIVEDGPIATLVNGSRVRLTVYDTATGSPTAQYGYNVEPIPKASTSANPFADNGLVELLAISETEFIAMERSFADGVGNTIKLFLISLDGATDVLGIPSLTSNNFTAVTKTLLLDLDTLGIPLDNIEGLSWGYDLANGNRSLILVSDNNFSTAQFTQFLAFEVESVPAPPALALLLAGLPLLAVARRRRGVIAGDAR